MILSQLLLRTFLAVTQTQLPIVDVGNARYQGTTNAGVSSYLGIRYAAAPTGHLRWRAPQPPPSLPGIQDASFPGPQCWMSPLGTSATNPLPKPSLQRRAPIPDFESGSEDCLFLNVFIPGGRIPKRKLPVIVWIHGGGYALGNATMFDPTYLVQVSQSVIMVAVQYRLAVYGFLAGSEIKEDGALNAGLLDQEFALEWVQNHISKFGGDPDQVTIWGQSAGGGSVLQQVIARDGRTGSRLFRAAIAGSTYLPPQYLFNSTIPESIYSRVVAHVGCNNSTNSLTCLRAADISLLQAANVNINMAGFFASPTLVPVVDGDFITQRATKALRRGKVNGRELLVVHNSDEGKMFVDQTKAETTAAGHAGALFPAFGPEETAAVARLYEGLGTPLEQANKVQGESIITCPSYFFLRSFPGAFKSSYAIPPALHGEDLGAYFPNFQAPTFDDPKFIASFSQSFINFARKLDPNFKSDPANITPEWPRYRTANGEMVFNRTEDGRPDIRVHSTDAGLIQRCAFWESVGHLTGQ